MTGSKNGPVSLFPSYLFQYDNLESPNVMGSDPAILVVNFSYFCDSMFSLHNVLIGNLAQQPHVTKQKAKLSDKEFFFLFLIFSQSVVSFSLYDVPKCSVNLSEVSALES